MAPVFLSSAIALFIETTYSNSYCASTLLAVIVVITSVFLRLMAQLGELCIDSLPAIASFCGCGILLEYLNLNRYLFYCVLY